MFQHNVLLLLRNFKRYKSSFLINLIGLSSGLACTLLIYLWVNDELSFDKFHAQDERLFQVMENQRVGERVIVKERTAGLLAETLKEQFPEVAYATPVMHSSWFPKFSLSASEDLTTKAVGQFVGKDFFNVFSFPLLTGEKELVLKEKNSVVISDALAMRLFNSTDLAVGKTIRVQLTPIDMEVTVTGVFERVPVNSSEKFDFLLSYEKFKDIGTYVLDWGNDGTNTYLVAKEGVDVAALNAKIAGLIQQHVPGSHRTLFLRKYSDGYLYGKYENGKTAGGRIDYVRLFTAVAVFILVIACINFMNLSTAKASRKIKEVGVKKAIGADRKTLITQYLSESIFMSFLALAIALLIVQLVLPQFNILTGKTLALTFSVEMVSVFAGMTLITGILAGSYPALYLSGFKPALVLKGKLHASVGELWTRKGLVVFQFAISVLLIVAVVVVYNQISFLQSKNPGYNKENIICFETEGKSAEQLETFLNELRNVPGVVKASSMWGNIIGGYSTTADVQWQGKRPDEKTAFEIMGANYDLLEMLEIKMAEGRMFSREHGSDTTKVIFNEAAVDQMNLADPIGKVVSIWGTPLEIVGVAKNFHFQSLHETVKPLYIRLQPKNTNMILAKLAAGSEAAALEQLQEFYKRNNPGFGFDYKFLDQDYQAQYAAEKRVAALSYYFAGLAILISCLGLFGLATFTAERRVKEIGIRKVLGSSELGIVYLLSGDFTKTVFIAVLLALPLGYALAVQWLDGFAYRVELSVWYFVGAGFAAFFVAWLTVGVQSIKAARLSLVNSLRSE